MRPLPKRKSQKPMTVSPEPTVVDIPSKMDKVIAPQKHYKRLSDVSVVI